MTEVGTAFVSVLPSAKGFGSKLNSEVGGDLDSAGKEGGKRFGTAFKVGALALMGGAFFAGKFLKGAIDDARESAVIGARTTNVIKSMGLQSQVSAKQIGSLATSISNKTGVDDEAIQSGQNLLLTFKNVARDAGQAGGVFDQTSRLMVDLSSAMGTDAKGAAVQLGKALNDPVKGVSALTRVGVSFSEQQKEQIAGFVEAGQLGKAQAIVLGELKNQFGGAAAAMATPADRLAVTYGNLKEQIGGLLIPVVDRFINLLLSAAPRVTAAVASIGDVFNTVQGALSGGGTSSLVGGIKSFAKIVVAQALPVLEVMRNTFETKILPALLALGGYLAKNLLPIFSSLAKMLITNVVPIVQRLAIFLYGTVYPAIIDVATAVAKNLKPVFDQLFATIRGTILPVLQQLLVKFREWQPTLEKIVVAVLQVVGGLLKFTSAVLAKVLPVVIRFVGWILSKLVPALANIVGGVIKTVAFLIRLGRAFANAAQPVFEFQRTVLEMVGKVIGAIASIPDKIRALAGAFRSAGKWVMDALLNGLSKAGGFISDFASGVWNVIRGYINGAIDKLNSALEFTINPPGPGSVTVNPADIPHLASGGVLTRPTLFLGGEGGEPEAVLPLSRLNKMLDGAGQGAAARGGQIARIVNWEKGLIYLEEVAGNVFDDRAALAGEHLRARPA